MLKKVMSLIGLGLVLAALLDGIMFGLAVHGKNLASEDCEKYGIECSVERKGYCSYDMVLRQDRFFGLYEKEERVNVNLKTMFCDGIADWGN